MPLTASWSPALGTGLSPATPDTLPLARIEGPAAGVVPPSSGAVWRTSMLIFPSWVRHFPWEALVVQRCATRGVRG